MFASNFVLDGINIVSKEKLLKADETKIANLLQQLKDDYKKDIDKIWDRFYKSDASRGRDKKGSGLGLSITKEIIQAHEEHIDVISTPDVGTEFIFTLPLAKG